jgi:hypothetical protein
MNDTVVRLAIILGVAVVVYALVTLVQRTRGRRSRPRPRLSAGGNPVHLPADDPHWRAYSERLAAQPEWKRARRADRARRRQRSTAAWAAGAVAGGSNDFGGSSCGGGGGCGGGGCGGG